jgi:hypothetical protein
VTPAPSHGTPAGEAVLAIRKLARATNQDVQDLMIEYVLEGLLGRLAESDHRTDFVLKGGVLLAAFAARRPTRDVDLQATRLTGEPEDVAQRVAEIAAIDVPDGVGFDTGSITTSAIREGAAYAGVRVSLAARLGTARLKIGVDVNFGDPIWPEPTPVEVPRVVDVGLDPVRVLGYPLEMVLAEKIVTVIERGEANTRWRDFADVHTLTGKSQVRADDLARSMRAVADYRSIRMVRLLPELEDMPRRAQAKWAAWRSRTGRTDLPGQFATVLARVASFADPCVLGHADGKTWNPKERSWS